MHIAQGAAAEAHVIIDPVVMLQDRLGIDESQARDLASIAVACPVPAADRHSSFGEFLSSPHGFLQAENIFTIAKQSQERGSSPEEAIGHGLGFAALRDSAGTLVRVTEQAESKKK